MNEMLRLAIPERLEDFRGRLAGPGAEAELLDLLRAELTARGVCSRRVLLDRLRQLTEPAGVDLGERPAELLEPLEAAGDVTGAPGGLLAAAPLRAVLLGGGRWSLHAGWPTEMLRGRLGIPGILADCPRRALLAQEQEADFRAAVVAQGGLILTPQRWAGLDRAPAADAAWLDELDDLLGRQPQVPAPEDEALVWRVYRPRPGENSQAHRWKTPDPEDTGRLWRARTEYGWWRFAWTAGGSPATRPHLRLDTDAACRTQFTLDRAAGTPLAFPVSRSGGGVEVEMDAWLPRAECRYLLTLGERVNADWPPRFRLPEPAWAEAAATLRERLGVEFQGGAAW